MKNLLFVAWVTVVISFVIIAGQDKNDFAWELFREQPINVIIEDESIETYVANDGGFQTLSDELSNTNEYYKTHEYSEVRNLLHKYWRKTQEKKGIFTAQAQPTTWKMVPSVGVDTEYDRNRAICGDLLECDITLTLDQVNEIIQEVDEDNVGRRKKRKVIKGSFYRWKSTTIPYTLGISDQRAINGIRAGIKNWEENTCIKFEEGGQGEDSIRFIQGSGCYSNIGRIGGQQQISIGRGCELVGITAHEIGHALGFWHEQSRDDRTSFVNINFDNVLPGQESQFEMRHNLNSFKIGYDLGSVMHYSSKDFSRNNERTITTLDPMAANTIGQRVGLSFIDAKLINFAYCSDICRDTANTCLHGGYPDPVGSGSNCNKCRCPNGLGGNKCERVDDSICGSDLSATNEWQTLTGNRKCNYVIKSSSGQIYLDVEKVSVDCRLTCRKYLEVKTNSNLEMTGNRYCCGVPENIIRTGKNIAVVLFNPGSSDSFKLRYRTDGASPPNPPPTLPPILDLWSTWSSCSATCGMCGTKRRTRCARGTRDEVKACGTQVCSRGTQITKNGDMCDEIENGPCDDLQLDWDDLFPDDRLFPENTGFPDNGGFPDLTAITIDNTDWLNIDDLINPRRRNARDVRIRNKRQFDDLNSWGGGSFSKLVKIEDNGNGMCTKTTTSSCEQENNNENSDKFCCDGFQVSGASCI